MWDDKDKVEQPHFKVLGGARTQECGAARGSNPFWVSEGGRRRRSSLHPREVLTGVSRMPLNKGAEGIGDCVPNHRVPERTRHRGGEIVGPGGRG